MKKIIAILFILVIQVFSQTVWDGTINTDWYNDLQTEFTITTAEELAGLARLVDDGNSFYNKTIKLDANIILNDTTKSNWSASETVNFWTPIGTWTSNSRSSPFRGTFDGNGNIVVGIRTYSGTRIGVGLFGYTEDGAIIKNLGIHWAYIYGTGDLGVLVGINEGIIINCYVTGGSVKSSRSGTGGLTGTNGSKSKIENCYTYVSVSSYSGGSGNVSMVGGLVGANFGGEIKNCYAKGEIIDGDYCGGLVGRNYGGLIINSHAKGGVRAESGCHGGLLGYNDSIGRVESCYATGDVLANGSIGGLIGANNGGIVTKSYATGNVSLTNHSSGYPYIGGLVGHNDSNGRIEYCYAQGNVKSYGDGGGLVGNNDGNAKIEYSYATGNVTHFVPTSGIIGSSNYVGKLVGRVIRGKINNCYASGKADASASNGIFGGAGGGGAIGNTHQLYSIVTNIYSPTSELMKQKNTFRDWDFDEIWFIDEEIDYPRLRSLELMCDHIWSDWIITIPPTCTSQGIETRTCQYDERHTQIRTIAMLSDEECELVSIKILKKSDGRYGIRFSKNIVSDNAEISVILPDNERAAETKIVIYDMTGNVVFVGANPRGCPFVWNLTNTAGRFVANGSYLVIAEVKSASGQRYRYSNKIGVKR